MTTQLLLRSSRNGRLILVNPNIGAQNSLSYHAVLLLHNRQENNECKMVKGTCLADPRRKVGTPQKLGPESPQKMAPVQCYLT
jgi:hypothetical protein